ncbi:MAG TPA: hypothetical protein VF088_16735 [Pyrinomonadaceae bacterium]
MRRVPTTASVFFLLISISALAHAQGTPAPVLVSYDFRNGAQGWQAGFADYPPFTDNGFYELKAEIRSLPPELGINGTGFYIQGNNHSDDLFMFLKRRLTAADGVVAGQTYQVTFTLVFASSAQSGCFGIGGAPGESVAMKAGASPAEPQPVLTSIYPTIFNWLRMNVDKSGVAASTVSNIANGIPCNPFLPTYVSLERHYQHTSLVNANSNGELWLLVGTDSGYEAMTAIYYQRIDVTLVPINPPAVPVLLTRTNTLRAAALDSVGLVGEPFPVISTQNPLNLNQPTRVTLFAYNLELKAGEGMSAITVRAQDAQNVVHDLPVQAVNEVPNFSWIKQVTVTLPDQLKGVGELSVWINLRGVASNKALMTIQ